jgi:ribosomal protein S1
VLTSTPNFNAVTANALARRGETVTGVVVQYEQKGLLVDIGAKASAYLPLREAGLVPVEDIESLFNIDDSLEFMVRDGSKRTVCMSITVYMQNFKRTYVMQ